MWAACPLSGVQRGFPGAQWALRRELCLKWMVVTERGLLLLRRPSDVLEIFRGREERSDRGSTEVTRGRKASISFLLNYLVIYFWLCWVFIFCMGFL